MPLTLDNAGALIYGNMGSGAQPKKQEEIMTTGKQQIKVKRSFYYNNIPVKTGEIIEVPSAFAREMIASDKAKEFTPPPPAADSAPALSAPGKEESSKISQKKQGGADK